MSTIKDVVITVEEAISDREYGIPPVDNFTPNCIVVYIGQSTDILTHGMFYTVSGITPCSISIDWLGYFPKQDFVKV